MRIQGPFGRFQYASKGREVWITGGIGITPFLGWAAALEPGTGPVDLFYCVRSRTEAPHVAEVQALADATPNLTLHMIETGDWPR